MRLPPELTDLIIDQLALETAVLHTCTMVCRAWLPRSRYYLFSDVLIRGTKRNSILDFPSPSTFSTATHRLMLMETTTLPPGIEYFTSVKSFYLLHSTASPGIISRIPRLFSNITTFELNRVSFDAFEDMVKLVCALPRLETLTVYMCHWTQELNPPPSYLRLPENLHTLNLTSLRVHVLLEWINTLETLPRISNVRFYEIDEPHIHSVGTTAQRLGSSLQHLTLELWDHNCGDLLVQSLNLNNNPNLRSFSLINGWPDLLQELLPTHPALQRVSLTLYEGKGTIPHLDLLNWHLLDKLIAQGGTALLTIRVYAHMLTSSVTRETVETRFLPRCGAKGLVRFVHERQHVLEVWKALRRIERDSWGERISVQEEVCLI